MLIVIYFGEKVNRYREKNVRFTKTYGKLRSLTASARQRCGETYVLRKPTANFGTRTKCGAIGKRTFHVQGWSTVNTVEGILLRGWAVGFINET